MLPTGQERCNILQKLVSTELAHQQQGGVDAQHSMTAAARSQSIGPDMRGLHGEAPGQDTHCGLSFISALATP